MVDEIFETCWCYVDSSNTQDGRMQRQIATALTRLPEEVRDFVVREQRVRIVCTPPSGIYGQTFRSEVFACPQLNRWKEGDPPPKIEPRWVVLITQDAYDLPDNDVQTLVAHEVAHAWLGQVHIGGCTGELEDTPEEQAVRAKAREWGFTGYSARE
jgi:hypothetical protein